MKAKLTKKVQNSRVKHGPCGSAESEGNNGLFVIEISRKRKAVCIISDQMGWEHVSVHIQSRDTLEDLYIQRIPTWAEMCFVKDQFWDEEETVLQYHPPKSEYVNCHPFVLHLWKKVGCDLERPPKIMVGPS